MKHSPAPWTATYGDYGSWIILDANGYLVEGEEFARVEGVLANALLIAKAPDMYLALETVAAISLLDERGPEYQLSVIVLMARKVIKDMTQEAIDQTKIFRS